MSGTAGAGRVRVALVGYGLAGRIFHAPLLSSDPGFEVVSVVTGDAERAAAAAADLPGARVVPDLAALLERAGDHDLAVVATTTGTHVPVAAATVAAGLATVVDKPIAATAAPARALVEDAERRGVALTVFQNRRWDSDTLAIRALLAAGTLGSVLRFESRFERFRPVVRATWRESGRVEDGAGVLLDLGSHLADQALYLFGPAQRVYARVAPVRDGGGDGPDDDAFLLLEHAGGVVSHLWAGMVAAAPGPRARVLGTAGGYVKEDLDGQEDALRAGRRPGTPGWVREPDGVLADADGPRPVPSPPGEWSAFYAGVRRMVTDDAPPPVDPRDAVAVMDVLDAARHSSAAHAVVALPPRHT